MAQHFDTRALPPETRRQLWRESVSKAYFELDLEYADPERFTGTLDSFTLGEVSLSLLRSAPLRYRRLASHLSADAEENYLLTVPVKASIEFSQRGRTTVCTPDSFTLERSGEPYEFSYDDPNELRVLKIPAVALGRRVGAPDRLCAVRFDAAGGAGALFADYLGIAARHAPTLGGGSSGVLSSQLLDLLAIVLEGAAEVGDSDETSVQGAHLRRIEHHIRTHLRDPDLTPATIAAATGVSLRYLHKLFRNSERTVAEFVRELRLQACREALVFGDPRTAIGAIAYEWGFSDQAHFTRAFKRRFGVSPGEARRRGC